MEKVKCIISDIDDTCLDFLRPTLAVHKWSTKEDYKREDLVEYQLPENIKKTFLKYEDWLYIGLPILPKVTEAFKKFKKAGFKIILMTARDEKYREQTCFNLAINGIEYDEIYFNKNKSLKINRLSEIYDIQYFIDDRLDNVNKVKKNTQVPYIYLINTYSNRNEDVEEGVIRINNIHEIKLDK